MDYIHGVKQLIRKSAEYKKPPYAQSIDQEKAFHPVDTAAPPEAFENRGQEETYIRLPEDIYKECMGRTNIHKKREINVPDQERSYTRKPYLSKTVYSLSGAGIQEA